MSLFLTRINAFFLAILTFFGFKIQTPDSLKPIVHDTQEEIITFNTVYPNVNGMCSDGKFLYILINDGKSDETSKSFIIKINPETKNLISAHEIMAGHATDICYNGRTDEFVLTNLEPANALTFVSASDMFIKKTITISSNVNSIAYDIYNDCYYTGQINGTYIINYDKNFNKIEYITTDTESNNFSSLDYYDGKIHVLTEKGNKIYTFGKSGDVYGSYQLPSDTGTSTGLCNIKGSFFVNYKSKKGNCSLFALYGFDGENTKKPTAEVVMNLPIEGGRKLVEGACASDKYVYEIMVSGNTGVLYKIDPKTWSVISKTEAIDTFGHGNDICYIPQTNELYIIHLTPNANEISVFDADTLEFKRLIDFGTTIYAAAYDPDGQLFYAGGRYSKNCIVTDFEFNRLNSFPMSIGSATIQGMEYSNNMVFQILYNPNTIKVFSTDGTELLNYKLPVYISEPENIFVYNGDFYATYNKPSKLGGVIYKLTEFTDIIKDKKAPQQ